MKTLMYTSLLSINENFDLTLFNQKISNIYLDIRL
jgi:hypothetical protein